MIALLDVGRSQGLITPTQWRAIAAGRVVRGVYCRCGNGNDAPDPTFDANVSGARAAGLAVGAYAVGFPLPEDDVHPGRDPVSQALSHWEQCASLGANAGELVPALDFEWPMPVDWTRWNVTAASVRGWGLAYLDAMEKLCGRTPMLYVYPDFAEHVLAGASAAELAAFARYAVWLARYGVGSPGAVGPWTAPTIWQKSDGGGRLPSGAPVDEDVFMGDEAAWSAFVGQAAA